MVYPLVNPEPSDIVTTKRSLQDNRVHNRSQTETEKTGKKLTSHASRAIRVIATTIAKRKFGEETFSTHAHTNKVRAKKEIF